MGRDRFSADFIFFLSDHFPKHRGTRQTRYFCFGCGPTAISLHAHDAACTRQTQRQRRVHFYSSKGIQRHKRYTIAAGQITPVAKKTRGDAQLRKWGSRFPPHVAQRGKQTARAAERRAAITWLRLHNSPAES